MTVTANPKYIGTRTPRKEDPRLITGEGTFTDDVMLQGMAYLTLVRSPHAHARIRRIDTAAARNEPGVVAVLTGKDLEATGMLPVFIAVPGMNGSKHMPIATDKARYTGDAVAAVVAESRGAAKSITSRSRWWSTRQRRSNPMRRSSTKSSDPISSSRIP